MNLPKTSRHKINSTLLYVLCVLFASTAYSQTRQPPTAKVTNDEYRVYVAVISEMFGGKSIDEGGNNPSQLVILEQTMGNFAADGQETSQNLKGRLKGLSDEAAADYIERNKTKGILTASLDMKFKYTLLSEKDHDDIFRGGPGGWTGFYKKYPGSAGYIGFSRVGFNKAGDQSVVYVDHGCGGLCGPGHYVLLEKTGNTWKVKEKMMAWIS